ncbi:hypothetical protein BKA62DRAFT_701572 [Auriculariales sp. MPI-PUGE-AT-0066]|nr:hypothetical protein BKA62DRAFT_701572 [Auriculariales sp. MPI-PUGE-AT-0066]
MVVITKSHSRRDEQEPLLARLESGATTATGVRGHQDTCHSKLSSDSLTPSEPPAYEDIHSGRKKRSPAARFGLAFLTALCVYTLLLLMLSLLSMRRYTARPTLTPTFPSREDGRVISRHAPASWTVATNNSGRYRRSADVSFELPLPDEHTGYYFLTRGSTAKGTVLYQPLEYDPAAKWVPAISVNLTILYNDDSQLAAASVVTLAKDASTEMGVGLYMPDGDADMHVILRVFVPVSIDPGVRGLTSYGHGTIFLQNPFLVVNTKLQTDTAPIQGQLIATFRASLLTESGAIVVDTQLGEGWPLPVPAGVVTNTQMGSRSGFIGGSVRPSRADSFAVLAETSTGNINVPITSIPPGAALEARAESDTGDVSFSLHSGFEGRATLHSVRGTVNLQVQMEITDPAGQARRHNIVGHPAGPDLKSWWGDIWWGDDTDRARRNSTVVLRTEQGICLLNIRD